MIREFFFGPEFFRAAVCLRERLAGSNPRIGAKSLSSQGCGFACIFLDKGSTPLGVRHLAAEHRSWQDVHCILLKGWILEDIVDLYHWLWAWHAVLNNETTESWAAWADANWEVWVFENGLSHVRPILINLLSAHRITFADKIFEKCHLDFDHPGWNQDSPQLLDKSVAAVAFLAPGYHEERGHHEGCCDDDTLHFFFDCQRT